MLTDLGGIFGAPTSVQASLERGLVHSITIMMYNKSMVLAFLHVSGAGTRMQESHKCGGSSTKTDVGR